MPSRHATNTAVVATVHHYLERAFPNRVTHTGWEADGKGPIFEVVHDQTRHQVIITSGFLAVCPDSAYTLRHSELTDYMREARSQNRRFLVLWQNGALHIRFTAL